jgi:hypothetical protein
MRVLNEALRVFSKSARRDMSACRGLKSARRDRQVLLKAASACIDHESAC